MGNYCTSCKSCNKEVEKDSEVKLGKVVIKRIPPSKELEEVMKYLSVEFIWITKLSVKGNQFNSSLFQRIFSKEKNQKRTRKRKSSNDKIPIATDEKSENLNSLNINSQEDKIEYKENYVFKNGAKYSGQWKNGMRQGFGTQIWPDGAKYEGYWKNNKANGKGKFWHVGGDIFEGEWVEDKANGWGIYIHVNGAQYEGNWKNDLQEGYGKETWEDNSKYEGYYKEGKKEGKGKYVWSDGSIYVGVWHDNKINGFVKLIRVYIHG